jgi:hypothetical protein|tara:strand:- start:432 stop:839 length:408 start_codon:yes stop_codon:yes gene_type:complete
VVFACVSNIGNVVDSTEQGGHTATDFYTWYFAIKVLSHQSFNLLGNSLFDFFRNRAFAARCNDASQDALPIKWYARTILLHYDEAASRFKSLIGCEAARAPEALAAAADSMATVSPSAVNDFIFVLIAVWADHMN